MIVVRRPVLRPQEVAHSSHGPVGNPDGYHTRQPIILLLPWR